MSDLERIKRHDGQRPITKTSTPKIETHSDFPKLTRDRSQSPSVTVFPTERGGVNANFSRVKVPFEREERIELLKQITVTPKGVAEVHNPQSIGVTAVTIDMDGAPQQIPLTNTSSGLILPIKFKSNVPVQVGFFVGERRESGGALSIGVADNPCLERRYSGDLTRRTQHDPARFDPLYASGHVPKKEDLGAVIRQGEAPGIPLCIASINDTYQELLRRVSGIKSDFELNVADQIRLEELGFDLGRTLGLFHRSHKDGLFAPTRQDQFMFVQPTDRVMTGRGVASDRFQIHVYKTEPRIANPDEGFTITDSFKDIRTDRGSVEIGYSHGRTSNTSPSFPTRVKELMAAFPIQIVSEWDGI